MDPLVTIGIPIYRRLHHLENVLQVVRSQDYPYIELLVSDNGMNGEKVPQLVDQYYSKPYKFRRNTTTVNMSTHFNQIINEASGEFFLLLADDDEITPSYVSELVRELTQSPQASVAISIQETMDDSGAVIRRSRETMPPMLSGIDFIRAAWGTQEFEFESFSTFLARTKNLQACGGFPDFWKAHASDDALLVKLCLDNYVVLNTRCSYRKRFYDSSHGYALPIQDLARGIRDFLGFLDTEPKLVEYARSHPVEWCEAKHYLVHMAWKTYYYRWTQLYRDRLTSAQWIRAGFALPFIPDYYRAVRAAFIAFALSAPLARVQKHAPGVYDIYRSAKSRFSKTH